MNRVYLDHAATTPLRPAARAAMHAAEAVFGNPGSVHAEGQKARALLDDARRNMAEMLGIRAERLVLTGGGTEAVNLAVRGVMAAAPGRAVAAGGVEHDCVLRVAEACDFVQIGVDSDGIVSLGDAEAALKRGNVTLLCLMHANNETGVLQPVAEAAELAHRYGALLLTDAVQTVGHFDVKPDALGADLLAFSAHKFGGPKGVGALVVNPALEFAPQVLGGMQERGRRAGTENVAGACGMAAALEEAGSGQGAAYRELMDRLLAGVQKIPGVEVVAPQAAKVSHVVQLRVPGKSGEDMVMAMDLAGVAVSQGSACSSGRVKSSHVLRAMGYSEKEAGEGLRISLGWTTTAADIDAALAALGRL